MTKFPNFDDVDLGILAIVAIVITGVIGACSLYLAGVEIQDIGIGLGFIVTAIGTIGGLARGKNNKKSEEQKE